MKIKLNDEKFQKEVKKELKHGKAPTIFFNFEYNQLKIKFSNEHKTTEYVTYFECDNYINGSVKELIISDLCADEEIIYWLLADEYSLECYYKNLDGFKRDGTGFIYCMDTLYVHNKKNKSIRLDRICTDYMHMVKY